MSGRAEMGGVELVCRLVAATPPYLYSPAGLPHCFFFSELLRNLVAKRCAGSIDSPASPPAKRFKIASSSSAFTSHQVGDRGFEEKAGSETDRSANPLSPSSFLPRLKQIYELPNDKARSTSSSSHAEYSADYVKHEKESNKH